MRKLLLITLLFISSQTIFAQDNVGIGTLTPNANALVDMETNNKGLLIPRLSSAQRLAIPTAGVVDEALLVYDLDLDVFFYWDGGQWIGFPLDNDPTNELQDLVFSNDTLYISNGNSIYLGPGGSSADDQQLSINGDTLILEDGGFVLLNNLTNTTILSDSSFVLNGDTISFPTDNDTDPTNELQNLSFDTDSIYLSDGNAIAISSFTTTNLYNDTTFVINGDTIILPTPNAGTDDQNLTLSNDTLFIEDGNFVVLPSGVVNTDNQNITINGDTLILEDGGFILLGDLTNITNLGDTSLVLNGDTISFPADADTDPTNELQDLAVVGDSLIINGGTNVFLGDLTSSNIINDTTLIINGDTLTLPSGGGINTDDQNLTLSNDTLFIEDGNFVVLPSGVVNTDDQNITINGDTLILEDGGFILLGDLTNITNLGDTSLVLNGDTIAFSVDADTDPTNELQDLAVVGDSLIINGGTNVFLGDLTNTTNLGDSSFVVNGDTINLSNSGTDDQNLTGATLLGNTLTIDIEDGNSVSVDLGSLAAGLDSIYGQGDSLILVSNGGVDTAFVDLGSVVDTDDQTLTLSNDTLFIADGNFVVLLDNVNDADFDPTNELQDLAVVGDSLIINGGTNVFLGDLTSSNIINDTTLIINGDTLTLPSGGGINTDDQNLTLSNDTLFIEDGNFVVLPSGVVNTDNQNITINGDTLILGDGGFILLGDLTNITNLGDSLLILNGDTISFPADADTDPTNELQDLAVVGDSLIINGGTNVFLGDLTNTTNLGDSSFVINGDTINLSNAGTDDQNLTGATLLGNTLTIDIEDGNSVSVDLGSLAAGLDSIYGQGDSLILVSNGGLDTAFVDLGNTIDTDDQTLTLSNDTLFIADGNFVVLPDNVNDADFDPTNELQDLSVVGDSLIINGGTNVFLGDLTSSNIINDTTLIINGDTLTLPSGGSINTDDQNLTLSNDTLFIEDGNFVVLPSGVVNTDNQNITINGDTLILEDGGFILLGDLTNITNLGDTSLVLNGDTISFPADADTDPTNELQDLAVVGDSLIINGGTNVFLGDLTNTTNLGDSSFVLNGDTINLTNAGTDNQNLTAATLLGNTLTIDIEDGNSVSVDLGPLAAGLDTIYGQGDSLILVSNGGLDTAFVDLGNTIDTDDQTLTLSNDTLFIADGNFVVLTDNVNDADFDPTNELQDLAVVGDSLIINGGTNVFLGDLTSSNIINDTTLIINGDTLTLPSGGGINTDDQNLTLSNDTLFIEDGNFVVLPSGVVNTDNQNITINGDTLILEDGGFILLGDITNITNLGDTAFVLNGDTIDFPNDLDPDPTNELQDLAVIGDSLIINGGTNVFLGDLTSSNIINDTTLIINGDTLTLPSGGGINTDDQNLTLSNDTLFIEDGNFVVLPSGVVNTDDQNITVNGDTLILEDGGFVLLEDLTTSNLYNDTTLVINGDTINLPSGGVYTDDQILTLSNDTLYIADGNFVVLTDNVNDADFDPTNELQDLAVVGDSLIINGGTNVFLGDLTSSNIINDTTLIINGDTLTLPSGGGINTDDQNLTLSNDTLFIEDGNFVVLPSGTVNTDDQNITINGDTLILEDGGFILLGDLTNITNLGDTLLVLNGDTISFPADADTDPTNELQDLAVVGDSLIINGGTNVFLGDLTNTTNLGDSSFIINGDTINLSNAGTDNQNLTGATLLGTTLTVDIEDGNSVSVDLGSLAAGIDTIYGQGDSLILVSNGGVDTAFVNLGGSTDTDDQTLTLSNDTLFIADGNFVILTDNVNDADFDSTNELQDLGINGDSITINGGSSISINDLSTSTVLNDSTIVVNGDTLIINGTGGVDTDDQTLSILGDQLTIANGNTITLPDNVNDADFDPTNELQDLAVVGDSLFINGGTNVFLGDLTNTTNLGDSSFVINGDTINLSNAGTDNQNLTGATLLGTTLTIDIEDGNSVNVDLGSLAAGLDSIYGQGDSLIFVSNGGVDTAYIDLGGFADTDDQTLSILGDQLTIADGNTITLTDVDPTNELQDLSFDADSIYISNGTAIAINDVAISGPAGPQGPAGTNGTNGTDGVDGTDGLDGALGPQGPIGLTGPAGADGTNGTNGIDGVDGTDGLDGAVGPQGPIGLTGPAGADGTNGTNGIDGVDGTDGLDGAVGPQGPIGLTGPAGADGTNGTNGIDGVDGTDGLDGAVGPQGPIGLTGPAGPAASDDQTLSILGDQLTISGGNTVTVPTYDGSDFALSNQTCPVGQVATGFTAAGVVICTPSDEDHDWYEQGSTNAPNNIADNIFTNGSVGIGTNTSTHALEIERTTTQTNLVQIGNNVGGNNVMYVSKQQSGGDGIVSETSGAVGNAGTPIVALQNNGYSLQTKSALRAFNTLGDWDTRLAHHIAGGGGNYGIYATTPAPNVYPVGGYFEITNAGTSVTNSKGVVARINRNNNAGSTNTAFEAQVLGTGTSTKYGFYTNIAPATGGIQYGIFSNVLNAASYSGYFLGRFSIGTTTANNYIMPASRGTNNQIMQTNAAGIVNWVDPTLLGLGDITSVTAGDGLTGGGATGAVTLNVVATNGLTDNANDIRLGGTLIQATEITQGANTMTYNLDGTGDFVIEDNGVAHFQVDANGNTNTGGDVYFRDENSATGTILGSFVDDGNDGRFQIMENGTISVDLDANTQFVFNQQGLNRDFRVESDGNPSMLFVDAGFNRVGIGEGAPQNTLHVNALNDPLRLDGLVTDNTLDEILVQDNNGVVHVRDASTLSAGSFWSLTGNAGTNPTTNFLGTTDAQDLVFRTNNTENMRININGNVGIGTASSAARLYVNTPNTDATTNYGIYNYFDGVDVGITYGMRTHNYGSGNSTKYGIANFVNNEGTGARYGFYNSTVQNTASNSASYGLANLNTTYGTGIHYGDYTDLNISGTAVSNFNYGSYRRIDFTTSTYSGDAYGDYTFMDYSSGTRYGEYKEISTNSVYDGDVYADYNEITGTGDGLATAVHNDMALTGTGEKRAVYTDFTANANGIQYGMYNNFDGTGISNKYGVRNEFSGTTTGTKYGVYNNFESGTGTGTIFGTYNRIQNDATATKYGTYNYIAGGEGTLMGSRNDVFPAATSTSTIYGVYANVSNAGTGLKYGGYFITSGVGNRAVFGQNATIGGYAGYFNGDGYWDGDMVFNETGQTTHNFRVESNTRPNMLLVDAGDDVVRIGNTVIGGGLAEQGTFLANIDGAGNGATVNYVANFDRGAGNDGTTIGIGSAELILDAGNQVAAVHADWVPFTDGARDLGNSFYRWRTLYATNGTINTSDTTLKKNIEPLSYGLKELMNIKTISYQWKDDKFGINKIGFNAQNLQTVLPEVVVDYDFILPDEKEGSEFVKVKTDRLGVYYSDIIPVTVKAIQEQQELILDLTKDVETLKEEKALSIQKVPNEMNSLIESTLAQIKAENEALKVENEKLQEENEAIKSRLKNIEIMLEKLLNNQEY